MTDVQCSPLGATFGARDGHYGGAFVLPPVDVLAAIFVREVVAVWLSITAQGLADAAACRDSEAHRFLQRWEGVLSRCSGRNLPVSLQVKLSPQ